MRRGWIALIGVGAAVLYGLLSRRLSGSWNAALSFEIGVAVAVALWGFRSRAAKEEEEAEKKVKDEGQGGNGEEKAGGENRWRAEDASGSAGQPTDDGREHAPGAPQSTGNADSLGNDCGALPQQNESDAKRPVHSPTPTQNSNVSAAPAAEAPEALWERARVMVHNVIPGFEEDAEYLNLVFSAAEGGHVPALAKLGDYAFRRGAFVEAYFWTKIAKRRLELAGGADPQGRKEIDDMLQNIRREWTAAGQPPEYENLYENFPEERSRIGRAFLRIDSGILVKQAGDFIQELAKKGNPDAALFVS